MEAGDFGSLFIRTVLIYFVVFLVMRFMGKREIGKMSVLDLVISFMIAEIAVIVIEDTSRSLWHGVFPMVLLMLIQIAISFVTMKNRKLRVLFDGKPSIIVEKGKLNSSIMRKGRYNLDDLMLQLRENGISTVGDVEFAILETSGKLSIIKKEGYAAESELLQSDNYKASQSASEDHKNSGAGIAAMPFEQASAKLRPMEPPSTTIFPSKYRFEMLPVPLIMDGKVQDENLKKMEKTRFWLKNELQPFGVNDFKDVFLCTIDHRGRWFVDLNRRTKP